MNILCAIDGSEFSHWSVESLVALAERPPKALILLYVLDIGGTRSGRAARRKPLKLPFTVLEKEGTKLLHRMEEVASMAFSQQARGHMTKIQSVLERGPVAETVIRQAQRRRTDLVMMGSRGFSDIQGFLLGSVSRKVVTHAPCPVLVVKRKLPEAPRIVLAVDQSKFSKAAARFLLTGLVGESTQVTVLSVVSPVVTDLGTGLLTASQLEVLTKPKRQQAKTLVSQYREMFLKEGCAVTTEVLEGHPSQTIVHYLEKHQADLVVMGSRGLTGMERFQLGSVSESVLKYAPCSVLVVRGRSR